MNDVLAIATSIATCRAPKRMLNQIALERRTLDELQTALTQAKAMRMTMEVAILEDAIVNERMAIAAGCGRY